MNYQPLASFAERAREIEQTLGNDPRLRDIYRRTIASIDPERVADLQAKYVQRLSSLDPNSYEKYADLPFWIAHKVDRAATFNLDRRKPLDILDLGIGAGHFPAICQALGHRVVGIDIDYPFYQDVCALLGIDRRSLGVYAGTRIGDLGTKFDLVTAIWISFDFKGTGPGGERRYWTIEDWAFLIKDLAANHLRRPGTIHFELNEQVDMTGTSALDEVFLSWAADQGAAVNMSSGIITFYFPAWKLQTGP